MFPTKIDQLAIYTQDPKSTRDLLGVLFGMTEWVQDIAVGSGEVYGTYHRTIAGDLSFNYQTGIEIEVLHYVTPDHWHSARARMAAEYMTPGLFVSHIGVHVDDMAEARKVYERAGWRVAQEVHTFTHTNPYLKERGRTFHYVVWDSRGIIGFDLKLIQRIEKAGTSRP